MKSLSFLAIILAITLLTAGCSSTYELRNPVPLEAKPAQIAKAVVYSVPVSAKLYAYKGNLNVQTITVEFGPSLEYTLRDALNLRFTEVSSQSSSELVTDIPMVTANFASVSVTPGALTFSSSSARVELEVELFHAGGNANSTKRVIGEATVSPGAAGAVPIPGFNDSAFNAALRRACELALSRAVEKAADEFVEFVSQGSS